MLALMRDVTRRHVLYIPGFDPVPPRAYRERYRRESTHQAQISGYELSQGPSGSDARYGWHVQARIEGAEVSTDLEVLYWADIVRRSMAGGIGASYLQLVRTAWAYIGSGALWRLMRLRKGPVIAALYPVAVLLGQGLLAILIAGLVGYLTHLGARFLIKEIVSSSMLLIMLGAGAFWYVTPIAGLFAGWMALIFFLRWCARRDHLYAWYLMKDYAFSSSLNGAYPPEQEARMRDFSDRIAEVLQGDADEVLIVGHSSGAYVAVSVLADLIRSGRVPEDGPVLSLLTLGHVVPMVSFLPRATRLRADLAYLCTRDEITWVDVTAPGDGCSFALCDPVAVSGVAPEGKHWPLVLSAAFSQTLSAKRRATLKWRLFELHFQYLNAFDNLPDAPDAYDYFRITAGPRTLADRFASRAPSRSRIERPVNRFTDIAA